MTLPSVRPSHFDSPPPRPFHLNTPQLIQQDTKFSRKLVETYPLLKAFDGFKAVTADATDDEVRMQGGWGGRKGKGVGGWWCMIGSCRLSPATRCVRA